MNMVITEIKSLCRPVESVYCIECCYRSGHPCYLLGKVEDGSEDCRGRNGKIFEGLTELQGCKDCKCWDLKKLKTLGVQGALQEYFSEMSDGRYNAQEVLDMFDLEPAHVKEIRESIVKKILGDLSWVI